MVAAVTVNRRSNLTPDIHTDGSRGAPGASSTRSNRTVIASATSLLSTVSSSGKQKNGENPAMGKLTTVSFPMAFEACQFSKYSPT
jgi:hypothetical protein